MNLRPSIKKYAMPEQERRKRIARKSKWKHASEVLAALEAAELENAIPCAASPISVYERKEAFSNRVRMLGYSAADAILVTLVFGWACIPAEMCTTQKILELKKKLQRYMRRISRTSSYAALFMTDFTFFKRLPGAANGEGYDIQVHYHGIMHKADESLLADLRKTRGAHNGIEGMRPIVVKSINCLDGAADYCMKFAWLLKPRRISPRTGRLKMERGVQPPDKPALQLYRALSKITPKQLEIKIGARNAERRGVPKRGARSAVRNTDPSQPRRRRRPLLLEGTRRFPAP